ncbi:hypothetical protein [Halocatena pleomorpha]|uniref:Uncharacterized protein n=1 Tax=Halocatena pleomorpha TaxID=1785090 RepID=A0A3P3RI71_9EURY|nr:hypothetical protein [Halocatena pleomorpha]RRJ33102.1 hypothetical protein EIK79_03490 [Halocatena pleomorpha]
MSYANSSVLFGRDRQLTRRFLVLAAVIFVASFVVYTSFPVYEGLPLTFLLIVPSIPIMAGTLALVSAYLNDGLLVSALLPVMAVLGLELSLGIWLYFDLVPSYDPAGISFVPLLITVAFGIGVGVAAVGAGIRRVVAHISS